MIVIIMAGVLMGHFISLNDLKVGSLWSDKHWGLFVIISPPVFAHNQLCIDVLDNEGRRNSYSWRKLHDFRLTVEPVGDPNE